ncbi:universal stress protein [Massilia sp. LXY-6]|uniref:universal stress protein n=1 Tax=Massilia sp. LXY-6 TaxID=3379823 RepID=UPI003EDF741C
MQLLRSSWWHAFAEWRRAAQAAARMAPAAHFVFVHAYRLADERLMREMELRPELVKMYRERSRHAARQRLQSCLERFSPPLPSADCVVEYGSPGHVIEECARRHGADLVVIGA